MASSLDELSRAVFGMTREEAIGKGICVQCRNPAECYSDAGRKEYRITGLCEFCFDKASDPDQCVNCSTPSSWHVHGKTACQKFECAPYVDPDPEEMDDE